MFYSCLVPLDESNMNSLEKKWQSRRIKYELSAKQMAVKANQMWTLYNTNGSQDESNMNSLQHKCSYLIRLDCHLFCRVHVLFVLTAICFVESSCLIPQHKWQSRRRKHEISTKQMVIQTNQTWTLYKRNGSQDESNMNSLQHKWLSRRIKHELSTKQILFCREFMFDSSWQLFLL
jgi:hypothetical protein